MAEKEVWYSFECQRSGVSPREFYNYVNRQMQKKCDASIRNWVEDYKTWAEPTNCTDGIEEHEHCYEDGETLRETIEIRPFHLHLYYEKNYNAILEFDDGNGYCYIIEYKR